MPNPSDYGLSHDSFREHQLESIQWCIDSNGGYSILEAPTGSGKTPIACATASRRSVIALCKTKNLQLENYGIGYGASVLFGRGSYECIHQDADGEMCDECGYNKMTECEYYPSCKYVVARNAAMYARFASLNYKYYLTARWPRAEKAPDVLFLDEAHELSDIVLDHAGCTINESTRTKWDLDVFPEVTPGMFVVKSNPISEALRWLRGCQASLRVQFRQLKSRGETKKMAQCENLGRKISASIDALDKCPDDWYIKSGRNARKVSRTQYAPAFIAKPLTAKHHFTSYFCNDTVIAMSATVGNTDAFCRELGIEEYDFRAVPHRFPASERKVHVLDVPGLNWKSPPEDYEKQAAEIAGAILKCPSDWSGIVHVTRKREAQSLASRIGRKGLGDRIWVTPGSDGNYVPTDEQVLAWNARRDTVPNSICVTWALWEGYNGLDEKINIVAKCPFPYIGDDYERARMDYSHSWFNQRTANQLEQGLNRTRRGRECDYGDGNGFVAIADGNWTKVRKYLSKAQREAIVE